LEDDSARIKQGREMGIVSLSSYLNIVYLKLLDLPPDRYEHDAPMLFDYLFKLTRIASTEYGCEYLLDDLEYIQSLPDSIRLEIFSLRKKEIDTHWDKDLEGGEKIAELEEIGQRLEMLGDQSYPPISKMHISGVYAQLGDKAGSIAMLREAIHGFEEHDHKIMLCQSLGVLGSYYEDIGQIDSMIICYERALDISNSIRHPIQAGRIMTFYAAYYMHEGRLGLGHELLYEAMERCREYKGGALEARYICRAMGFYADLECWDLVSDLLNRADVLQRLYSDKSDLYYYRTDLYSRRIDEIRARFAMARGELEKAESIYKRIATEPVGEFHPVDQIRIYYFWAKGLVDNERLQRAAVICGQGREFAKRSNFKDWEARMTLLEARLEYMNGNMREAESKLQRFYILASDFEVSLYKEILLGYDLLGRVKLASGDVEGAYEQLISGLDELLLYITTRDASAHSYLLFARFEVFKDLFHDLVAYSPSLGYGVELYWKRFYRGIGAASKGETADFGFSSNEDVISDVKELSERNLTRITEQGSTHCVFSIHNSEIWRWTASAGRIEREKIDIGVEELHEMVRETLELMLVPSGDGYSRPPIELTEKLRVLAEVLLPERLLRPSDESASGPLYISADGFIGLVPFEAYNIGEKGEYVPLLEHYDVVYLRHTDVASPRGGCQSGVIVVNTEPVSTVRNKRIFAEHLPDIIGEGDAMAEADINATKLMGKEANKPNLLALWEEASYIYLATHIFRDSEVPYLVHIPLAEPEKEVDISMKYLDATDIHAADLSRCRLVVLSGCSSGAPYCESAASGPALGDIFLDSGVRAVIHTNWNVEDEPSKELMASFIRAWCDHGMSPAASLCRVRRDAMRDDEGIRHPFTWASYSIKVGFLP
jgi:hypothetical protein